MVLSALLMFALQDVGVTYEPFAGLQLKLNRVPFVVGSSFQYFDAKTGKGLYSSRWAPKEVSRLLDGTIRVRYSGDNGNAIGTHEFTQRPGGMTVRYEFRWRGDGDVRVENCMAQFWAPAVSHGSLSIDGSPLFAFERPLTGDWPVRRMGAGTDFAFDSQLAKVTLNVRGAPSALYDARGYGQDWAKFDCLFWLGQQNLIVHPGQTTSVTAEWDFEPRIQPHRDLDKLTLNAIDVPNALTPPTTAPLLIPRPKTVEPSVGVLNLTSGESPLSDKSLTNVLARRWRVDPSELKFSYDSRIDPAGLEKEGFDLRITPAGVAVRAHDVAAQNDAAEALGQLAESRNGRLVLPCGTWKDWPSIKSRGVHLFPAADDQAFEQTLCDRLLAPLRFNRVVVECSRTQWDSVPESKSKPWVSKVDLARFFADLRSHNIEPVPLIQSFGHMDWLLDGEFKDMAVNSAIPYTLDPRKVKARELIKAVWREAAELLKPSTVHFGLDEISMRGMPDDPTLPSRLWKVLVPELTRLARELKATPMVWSDMMLAPDEAPDATHARNSTDASEFRGLLPKETLIGDWHYKSTKDPSQFKSLALWKSLGMVPFATSWYQPDNIRSHTLAAGLVGAGTLQSTWAGYETTESAVLKDPAQFSAYVLAADYAWSGREDPVASLPYDSGAVLRRLLWGTPNPFRSLPGHQWRRGSSGTKIRIGCVGFQLFDPIGVQTPLSSEGASCPGSIQLKVGSPAREVWLALDCVGWQHDADPVAKVTVLSPDGDTTSTILYGADVRAADDLRPSVRCESLAGVSAFRIDLGSVKAVDSIRIEPLSPTAGLRLRGLTTL